MWPRIGEPTARFEIALSERPPLHGELGSNSLALSRDGRWLAFVAEEDGQFVLVTQAVGDLRSTVVARSENPNLAPFFSPGAPVTVGPIPGGQGRAHASRDVVSAKVR